MIHASNQLKAPTKCYPFRDKSIGCPIDSGGSGVPRSNLLPSVVGIMVLALAVACSTQPPGRPDLLGSTTPTQPRDTTRIPLTPYFRGLKTASLRIDGSDYTFLVDTAGGRTLLAPEVAATLGCTPRGRDVGYRMNGEPVVFQNCPVLSGMLSSLPVHVAPVAVFDINGLLPAELPRLHGSLALDAFRGQVLTLDWARNALVVHSAPDGTDALRRNGLPIRFATGETGTALSVLVPVQSARTQLWFLLDSGNVKGTLVDRRLLQDGSIQLKVDSFAQFRVGTGGEESLQVLADDINYDGVLGTEFLQSHLISIDLRRAP